MKNLEIAQAHSSGEYKGDKYADINQINKIDSYRNNQTFKTMQGQEIIAI